MSTATAATSDDAPASRDDLDIPALALCLVCGRSDCSGCAEEAPRAIPSTPWETPGGPRLRRLWQTARLATVDGETFFGGLGDGSVSRALSFAFVCELLAIASLALSWIPVVYAFVPGFVESVLHDVEHRRLVLAFLAASVPALALVMVALHVSWALGLEVGLRVAGAEARAAHCLRYALYSCGWDLVTSPFGFGAGIVTGGWSGATSELRAAVRIPRTATRAYLGRARRASEGTAKRAVVIAVALTGTLVIGASVLLGVAIVASMV